MTNKLYTSAIVSILIICNEKLSFWQKHAIQTVCGDFHTFSNGSGVLACFTKTVKNS